MNRVFIVLVLGAVAACGGGSQTPAPEPAIPSTLHYAPHSARYVAVSQGWQEQQVPGGATSTEFGFRVHLTTVLVEESGGLGITITVDSVAEASGVGIPPSDLVDAAGTTFTGRVANTGEILDFAGGDTTIAFVRQLYTAFEEFLPSIPSGGAELGATWIDTAVAITNSGGIEIEVVSVASHEVVGWTTHLGFEAMHIMTRSRYTLSGEGSQMGQAITIDGTGTREEHSYVAAVGVYLGGWEADSANMNALITSVGMSIPIIQVRNDSLLYRPR